MTTQSTPLIISHLTRSYPTPGGALSILADISLEVAGGEAVAVVGPSGSGKSTLLHIIGSLDRPTSGTVRLGEVEITALEGKALAAFRAGRVGFIFQDHHLLPQLTALENVLLPSLALPAEGTEAHARALLARVGLEERAGAFPARMSGGERQRVAVARALINRPALLLCDEPTGNLDHETGASVVSLFLDLARENGVTVLMVTHNTAQAARFDRCLELRGGTLRAAEGMR